MHLSILSFVKRFNPVLGNFERHALVSEDAQLYDPCLLYDDLFTRQASSLYLTQVMQWYNIYFVCNLMPKLVWL